MLVTDRSRGGGERRARVGGGAARLLVAKEPPAAGQATVQATAETLIHRVPGGNAP
jgi:hypothetical protein